MNKLEDYYYHFVKAENIGKMFSISAGHGQVINISLVRLCVCVCVTGGIYYR